MKNKKVVKSKDNKNDSRILISILLFGLFLLFISLFLNNGFVKKPVELMVLEIYGFSFAYFGAFGYFILNEKNNYKKSWKFLKETKYYILFTLIVFVIFAIVGYFIEIGFMTEIIKNTVAGLIEKTKDLNFIEMFWFIFLNNSSVAFTSIVLGFFFGFMPFLTTIFNSYVIGFIMKNAVDTSGLSVALKLMPHGIFEIPAIIISISLGIRFGMFIFSKYPGKTFKDYWKNSIRILVFILIPLLLIAAIIETGLIFLVG